jgi:hypothetical protein
VERLLPAGEVVEAEEVRISRLPGLPIAGGSRGEVGGGGGSPAAVVVRPAEETRRRGSAAD